MRLFLPVLFFLTTPLLAAPQPAVPTPETAPPALTRLSLEDAVRLAGQHNPDLGYHQAAADAARETQEAGSRFFMRNPELRLSAIHDRGSREFDNFNFSWERQNETDYSAGLRFYPNNPWERKSLRTMLAARTTAASSEALSETHKLEAEIALFYYRALYRQELASLRAEEARVREENHAEQRRRRDQQQARAAEVLRARADALQAHSACDASEAEAFLARQELLALIGAPRINAARLALTTQFENDPSGLLELNRLKLIARALRNRPDLQHLRDAAAAAHSTHKWRESEDTFALSFIEPYAGYRSGGNSSTEFGLKLGISIPLFAQDPVRAAEALGEARALEHQWLLLQQAITAEVDSALAALKFSASRWKALQDELKALEDDVSEAIDSAQNNPGLHQPEDLLRLRLTLLDVRTSVLDVQFRTQQAVQRLNNALGTPSAQALPR